MKAKLLICVVALTASFVALSALAPVDSGARPSAYPPRVLYAAAPLVILQAQGREPQMPARGPLSPKPPIPEEAKGKGKTTAIVLVIIGVVVILPLVLAGMRKKR